MDNYDSFNLSHTLAYSLIGLQQMNLAFSYPVLFWNTANIITDSMATDLLMQDEDEIGFIEDDEEEEESNSVTDYGKIASAIGRMKNYGVEINLPDINKSSLTFAPNVEENAIYYGLKGISKINNKIAESIIVSRPYISIDDFLNKNKLNKLQIVSLIKSGAFDSFIDRELAMKNYLFTISDHKEKLTLQNVQMLMSYKLLGDEVSYEKKVFNFNKYIKKTKMKSDFILDEIAYKFYSTNYDIDNLHFKIEDGVNLCLLDQGLWEKTYKKEMNKMRDYIKANEKELLEKLNYELARENIEKYGLGTLSAWEMASVSFYKHDHELAGLSSSMYNFKDFNTLSEEPEVDYSFLSKEGYEIKMYKLYRIAGTVLSRDKVKHTVTLLTTTGVVTVKIWGNQFTKYDKQISQIQENGKKKVIEKSWFSRGNKIIFTGIRKDNNFIPKTYKNSEFKDPIVLITNIENGLITVKTERSE